MGIFGPNINQMVRKKDIKGLSELFRTASNLNTRIKAAEGICKTGDVKAMIKMMDEPGTLVIFVQGLVKQGASAFGPLVSALDDKNSLRQGGAATVLGILGKNGDRRAIHELVVFVKRESEKKKSQATLMPALIGLGNIGNLEAKNAIEYVAKHHPDPEVQLSAHQILLEYF
jgi:hypothetical protein